MSASLKQAGIEELLLSPTRPSGYVPRPSATLKRRIAEHGVLEPLAVRPKGGRYEILTRPEVWVAAGQVGLREVPVSVHTDLSEAEVAEIVADHYQSSALNPMDEARELEDQLDQLGGRGQYGAITRLARRLDKPRAQLAHSLRLLELPLDVQDHIERGELSAGQARPLVTVGGRRRQIQLAEKIIAERLSVRGAERLASKYRGGGLSQDEPPQRVTPDADLLRLQQRVSELAGCPFDIRGGEAVFNFFGDYEILDGLLERLGYRHE